MNNGLYASLVEATKFHNVQQEFLNRIESNKSQIDEIQANAESVRKNLSVWRKNALFWLGCFLVVSVVLYLVTGEGAGEDLLTLIAAVAIVGGTGLIMIFYKKIINKILLAKFEKEYENQIKPRIAELEQENRNLRTKVKEFEAKYGELSEVVPPAYRNLQAVSFMTWVVANDRADTLREAINLYEEQLHRWKLEDAARQTAEAQEYVALAMDHLNMQQMEANARLKSIEYTQYLQMVLN